MIAEMAWYTAFQKIIDYIIRLAAGRKASRKEVFEGTIAKLYPLIETVHSRYLGWLRVALDACPHEIAPGKWRCMRNGKRVNLSTPTQVRNAVSSMKKNLRDLQQRLGQERTTLYAQTVAVLNVPIHQPEKRFVWGIISYLLYTDKQIGPDHFIDAEIKCINRKEFSALRTPSSKLWAEIEHLEKPKWIYDYVERCELDLIERWKEVNGLWVRAKLAIAQT